MDTVFDDGTVAERPFRVDEGIARGPGVSDMKAGLLAGFFAVQALQDEGVETFGQVTYVCNPDEEIGSPFSRPRIAELAAEHDVAFVLEGARANGDIVSARKGITDYRLVVTGRAAHAGVEPEKGRNAILEATQQLQAIAALQGRWPGVTVNVGTIAGGTRTNVVPGRCEYGIDVRSPELRTLEAAEAEIERLATTPTIEGTSTRVAKHAWHRPMEKGKGATRLVALAGSIAHELGFELHDAPTGGASDGNTTAAAGTPTIDGLGPIGGDDHGPAEWLDVASIVPRTALLAALIARA
jgi:glutamate carboxypeptidase